MNNNNNHDKSYSDKLAEIAREAEKDPARNKIDPLENYDIEGPDVREVDPTPIVPVGNPVPGFESQHHAGEVAAVAPIIDASDDHLTEEEAIAAARRDAIDDPDEDLIPLRPDGTDPLTDIDPDEYEEPVEPVEPLDMFDPVDRPLRPDGTMDAPADSDVLAAVDPVDPVDPSDRLFENPNGSPRPLSQDEFGVDRPLEDPDRPVGADDVDERPLIERLADAFDGSPDHPTYTRVEDQDVNTPQENLDEYRDGRVADETRYPIRKKRLIGSVNRSPRKSMMSSIRSVE